MPMAALEVAPMLRRAIWWCGNLPGMVENVQQNACSRSRCLMARLGSRNVNSANMRFDRGISAYLGNPGRHCDNNVVHDVTEAAGPCP